MRFNHLDDWLNWQQTLNPAEIELGLDRISSVLKQADLASSFDCPLITVAGTNGKGSVVTILESIAISAGLRVCSYTSPHVFRYNERIKIDGKTVDDDSLCQAFDRIDRARCEVSEGEVPLTYFEFGTLAAIDIFHRYKPDIVLFEVGLGGRLDATNVMDSDISVLTSVAIDHVDWLGDDRESIGHEKAGVFRAGKTVVCGEPDPPESVIRHAQSLACKLLKIGHDYDVVPQPGDYVRPSTVSDKKSWTLKSSFGDIADLPAPALVGEFQKLNAATAMVAFQAVMNDRQFSIPNHSDLVTVMSHAMRSVSMIGRFQTLRQHPAVIVDVAHNQQAAQMLASQLSSGTGDTYDKTWAIIAMLSDKDTEAVIDAVSDSVDHWCLAGLDHIDRGLSALQLSRRFVLSDSAAGIDLDKKLEDELSKNQCTILSADTMAADTVAHACESVFSKAKKGDRIIVFGSFYTVAGAIEYFQDSKR